MARERAETARDSSLANPAVGGAVGGAMGAVYGTCKAIRCKVPGLLKVRCIGHATINGAFAIGLLLGVGGLIHRGKSY